jgi:hypothetical protein
MRQKARRQSAGRGIREGGVSGMIKKLIDKKMAKAGKVIPYRDAKSLSQFMDQPKIKIAEAITGALAMGKSEAILVGGRIMQGVLKGNAMKQFTREIKNLIEKGKIKEDYVETKYGFRSLSELLEFIDSEIPDENRLSAVKILFYSIVSADVNEGEQIQNYQIFQIAKRLTSTQFLILKIAYDMKKEGIYDSASESANGWLSKVSERIGHNIPSLIERDEEILIKEKLISDRALGDRSGILKKQDARLTDLGLKICENMEKYSF